MPENKNGNSNNQASGNSPLQGVNPPQIPTQTIRDGEPKIIGKKDGLFSNRKK